MESAGDTTAERRILVVEDSETVRGLVCEILHLAGYPVLSAADPEEALATCERLDGPVALLVTDVIMPGMTGLELAGRLAGRYPALKVIYISGYTGDTMIDEAALAERGAFLQKPFTPDVLIGAVEAALDG